MRALLVAAVLAAATGVASADDMRPVNDRWPGLPSHRGPSMEQQIADWVSHMGGGVNDHLHLLSHDVVGLSVDGRGQRAHLTFHAESHYVGFDMDNNIHVGDGMAKVRVNLRLRVGSRSMAVHVPEVSVVPTDYHGERYVELRLPVWEARW